MLNRQVWHFSYLQFKNVLNLSNFISIFNNDRFLNQIL